MPATITFDALVNRFGEISAWQYLTEIEKASGFKPQASVPDPEARLAKALRAQDTAHYSKAA